VQNHRATWRLGLLRERFGELCRRCGDRECGSGQCRFQRLHGAKRLGNSGPAIGVSLGWTTRSNSRAGPGRLCSDGTRAGPCALFTGRTGLHSGGDARALRRGPPVQRHHLFRLDSLNLGGPTPRGRPPRQPFSPLLGRNFRGCLDGRGASSSHDDFRRS